MKRLCVSLLVLALVLMVLIDAGSKSRSKSKSRRRRSAVRFRRLRFSWTRTQTNVRTQQKPKTQTDDKLKQVAKQLLMQQFYMEQNARSDGHSGLKVMRLRKEGTRPYHAATHADDYTCSATHDHADFYDTLGMGEIVAVLNGVQFTSRHNDFMLVRKSTTSMEYGATEKIPYPDVPPSVTRCRSVEAQIKEMREYVRAWQEQDESIRDYKPYFKANLCYMEGAWTKADPETIQEAFFSERHRYRADSWNDMFQKIRFSAYTGTKDNKEDVGFLPTTLWEIDEDGECTYGQWNYRIFCHPLKDDLPLKRLRPVDDLKTRMSTLKTFEEYVNGRHARFQINPLEQDDWYDGPTRHGFIDKLMAQIPGMDNEGQVLEDNGFGNTIKAFDAHPDDDSILNAAYYHRWFQNKEVGALGVKIRHRGYNDENLWMAMNTQENILPIKVDSCKTDRYGIQTCQSFEQRWSFAIPMEIVYTTCLNSWNPYNIEFKGYDTSPEGRTVYEGPYGSRRDGKNDPDRAYNGANSAKYYRLPYEFFEEGEVGVDPADTPKNFVYVLDTYGNVRKVRGSGMRTFLPHIPGINKKIRTRYLVPPIYTEGNTISKELEALKDIVLNPKRYEFMFHRDPRPIVFPVRLILTAGPAGHTHEVTLYEYDQELLDQGKTVTVVTTFANNHQHQLVIKRSGSGKYFTYKYTSCSGQTTCRDGHPNKLSIDDRKNW